MENVGIVVQARTGSTRLPNKMVMVIEGKTLFEHIIERLKYTRYKENIVLATTDKDRDDILVDLSNKLGIKNFRGPEDDVLARFLGATKTYNLDIIVRVCADNPFIDPEGIDKLVDYLKETKADHVDSYHEKGWPSGAGAEAITRDALFRIDDLTKDLKYREHVTLFARDPANADRFITKKLDAPEEILRPKLKLSVDTQDDLEAARRVYKILYQPGKIIPLKSMVKLTDDHPEILLNVNDKTIFSYDLAHYLKK
jgi:spore coat polysaccharide biosynthesis protein SpsF